MNFLITLLEFVGALVALIIVHELGHFIVARLLKVEVEEFGVGFPPRLLTLFEAGGTKFTLNAIPLGGFVRPKGENDPSIPGGLAAANPWVRLAVLIAGPLMNLMLGVILSAIVIAQIGVADETRADHVIVKVIAPNSPAQMAGLRVNDRILEVNGERITSADKLYNMIYANLGQPMDFVVARDSSQTLNMTITPRENPPPNQGAIGIAMGTPERPVAWVEALPLGFRAVYEYSVALLSLPVQMIQGNASGDEGRLVGLKGMFDIYQTVQTEEVAPGVPTSINPLLFFTNITISLGLLNLVPFPALDGGRILFTLPEILFRRRIPPEYENWINLIGLAILLILMLYVNLQDFISPVTLP